MNFFLGTLYPCNGGWILTVVRAHPVPGFSAYSRPATVTGPE